MRLVTRSAVIVLAVGLASSATAQAPLTPGQMEVFLRTADVVDSTRAGKGVTRPWRLTLSDGEIRHDALFQSIDEHRTRANVGGREVLHWADSYKCNIAAYRLAKLVGVSHMIPVTVDREWQGSQGSLTWWIDVIADEEQRIEDDVEPPNMAAWRGQYQSMKVFAELVHDTDRNQGNVLYDPNWRLWMIDFTRAFGISDRLMDPDDLRRVDRAFFRRIEQLQPDDVHVALGDLLSELQIEALRARRSAIVRYVRAQIRQHGEENVLY